MNQLNQIDEAEYIEYEDTSNVDRMFIYTIGVLFSNDIGEEKGVEKYLNKVTSSTHTIDQASAENQKERTNSSQVRFMVG